MYVRPYPHILQGKEETWSQITLRVGHFILEERYVGYKVPQDVKRLVMEYMRETRIIPSEKMMQYCGLEWHDLVEMYYISTAEIFDFLGHIRDREIKVCVDFVEPRAFASEIMIPGIRCFLPHVMFEKRDEGGRGRGYVQMHVREGEMSCELAVIAALGGREYTHRVYGGKEEIGIEIEGGEEGEVRECVKRWCEEFRLGKVYWRIVQ